MKRKFTCTITRVLEIEIPDSEINEETLETFCTRIQPNADWHDIWDHAAQYIARTDDEFVEGIGRVPFKVIYEDIEVEN